MADICSNYSASPSCTNSNNTQRPPPVTLSMGRFLKGFTSPSHRISRPIWLNKPAHRRVGAEHSHSMADALIAGQNHGHHSFPHPGTALHPRIGAERLGEEGRVLFTYLPTWVLRIPGFCKRCRPNQHQQLRGTLVVVSNHTPVRISS